jgi:hypothetical protein
MAIRALEDFELDVVSAGKRKHHEAPANGGTTGGGGTNKSKIVNVVVLVANKGGEISDFEIDIDNNVTQTA